MNLVAAHPDLKCRARSNRTVRCDDRFVHSERLCFRHACLFEVWIARGGHRAYGFKGSTVAEEDPEQLRRWKRAQFHKWLDTLTAEDVAGLMKNG